MAHLTEEDVLRFKSYYSMCPKPLRYKDIKELAEIIKMPRKPGVRIHLGGILEYIASMAILFNMNRLTRTEGGHLFNELYRFIIPKEHIV